MQTIEEVLSHCIIVWPSACWEWQRSPRGFDYGKVWFNGRDQSVHRVVYMELIGPIPPGMHLHHECRNVKCCNPEHLEIKTPREHIFTGDNVVTRNKSKTHCEHGHPFDEKNTCLYNGTRRCYTCILNRSRETAARKASPIGRNADKTHCVHGHPFSEENTYISSSNGQRVCRECRRISQRAYQLRKKAKTNEQ